MSREALELYTRTYFTQPDRRSDKQFTVTREWLQKRINDRYQKTWGWPKWALFCQELMNEGYHVEIYESQSTVSKYIWVWHVEQPADPIKVRFSNHPPNEVKERHGDCDYYVGKGNYGYRTTQECLDQIRRHFNILSMDSEVCWG